MTDHVLTALFVVEAEAERAATQLRAVGLNDADVTVGLDDPEDDRGDEVGVPDSAAGLAGLRGGEGEPDARVRLSVRLEHARADRDEIIGIINAAGGRIA